MTDIQHFAKLSKDIKFAMLTTICKDDQSLKSRPMTLQDAEFDGYLWFFADRFSKMAHDIEENSKVNLAFADIKLNSYLSATGHAEVVIDKQKAKELWSPFYKAWFEQGLDDPKLGLIKVSVESADYWESLSSPIVHLVGFAKAILSGKKVDAATLGKHGHMNIS